MIDMKPSFLSGLRETAVFATAGRAMCDIRCHALRHGAHEAARSERRRSRERKSARSTSPSASRFSTSVSCSPTSWRSRSVCNRCCTAAGNRNLSRSCGSSTSIVSVMAKKLSEGRLTQLRPRWAIIAKRRAGVMQRSRMACNVEFSGGGMHDPRRCITPDKKPRAEARGHREHAANPATITPDSTPSNDAVQRGQRDGAERGVPRLPPGASCRTGCNHPQESGPPGDRKCVCLTDCRAHASRPHGGMADAHLNHELLRRCGLLPGLGGGG